MDELTRSLIGCTDAQVWAKTFVEIVQENPTIPTDEGTMIGWFANAIMSGYDEGMSKERRRDISDKLRELAFQSAGAASVPFMMDHPDYVMPTEQITEGVNKVLEDFGIPTGDDEDDGEPVSSEITQEVS
jgi:hypothetical protein